MVFDFIRNKYVPDERWLDLAVGTKEALNNPAAALMFATLIAALSCVPDKVVRNAGEAVDRAVR